MSENGTCIEKAALVDYLYGESDAEARSRVDAHLRSCERCAGELRSLTDVRGTIAAWEPPDADLGFRVVAEARRPVPARPRWRPAWALAAAAVLAVAAALVIRPEIEVRSGGSVLRIGWSGGGAGAPAGSGGMQSESGGMPSESGGMQSESGGMPSGSGGTPSGSGGMPSESGGMPSESGGGVAESRRAPAGPDARPTAVEPAAGPTLRGTPAGLRTGGGAVPIPGPGLGADAEPMAADDILLQQLRDLIRDDAAARQELAEYVHRVSERR